MGIIHNAVFLMASPRLSQIHCQQSKPDIFVRYDMISSIVLSALNLKSSLFEVNTFNLTL